MTSACSRGPASAIEMQLNTNVSATNSRHNVRWLLNTSVGVQCVLLIITIVPLVECHCLVCGPQ